MRHPHDSTLPASAMTGLDSALAREAATREILHAISASRTDPAPVFKAILRNAAQLSGAPLANLCLANEARSHWQLVDHFGDGLRHLSVGGSPRALDSDLLPAVAIRTARMLHIDDLADTDLYRKGDPGRVAMVDEEGMRTILCVPLLTGEEAIGCITLFRREIKAFTKDEITLVETFATQAVIAIENVRQFREVQDRLEREAATRNILQVIAQSTDNEEPVFDAILESATRLCNAPLAFLSIVNDEGTHFTVPAHLGGSPEMAKVWDEQIEPLAGSDLTTARAIETKEIIHVDDLSNDPVFNLANPRRAELVTLENVRTYLVIPLIRGEQAIGTINLYRREVLPFTPEQIALAKTFSAQAVIAIENVRQFREVQTRLEREKASAEILGVISRSRDDDAPVFETVLRNARRLCGASTAALMLGRPEDEKLVLAALDHGGSAADQNKDRDDRIARINAIGLRMDPKVHVSAQAICEGRIVQIPDLREAEGYLSRETSFLVMVEEQGQRSMLSVPLVDRQGPLGAINLHRQEPGLFSQDEVYLIETFAAQAVIAIENVRQFREVHERLEREKASRQILDVIAQSRDDESPVFNVLLESAVRLCQADQATLQLVNESRTRFFLAAGWGLDKTAFPIGQDWPLDGPQPVPAAIRSGQAVNIADFKETPYYQSGDPVVTRIVDTEGVRSRLAVPLLQNGIAMGTISLSRRDVRPFSSSDIQLVETFAAQAVIAIENVRQFHQVQTRLEREAATKDILQVISRSRDDERPVFEAILKNAARLCHAPEAVLMLRTDTGTAFRAAATYGKPVDPEMEWPVDSPLPIAEAFRQATTIHVQDMQQSAPYLAGDPTYIRMVDGAGLRTRLCVPLMQDGQAFGVIAVSRTEVAPFDAGEIALIETFASQAVIAIENVRQFNALATMNVELETRVSEQVGEIERMGRLKRFLPSAVVDTVVSSGSENLLRSHRALLGVLFCDIRGFTAFCETAEPEETIEVLQTYHEEMGKLINAFGAGVDHRMGDGIMVLFNDPLPCDDPAGDAVRLAVAMHERMADLSKRWKRLGFRLGFGVGVSLGYATVGMVGYEGRFDYTASGTAINLAARLCDEAKDGEILLSPRAAIAIEDDFGVESCGEMTFKGLREPLEVFRLTATRA